MERVKYVVGAREKKRKNREALGRWESVKGSDFCRLISFCVIKVPS